MKVVSFFTGAGGLDLGLEMAGFQTVLSIEIDPDCRRTLQFNRPEWHPTAEHDGDITKFTAADIRLLAGLSSNEDLDLVAGGPPCQSFSNLGKRGGITDARGALIPRYADLVYTLRPKMFVFENVQGILNHPEAIDALSLRLNRRYKINMRLVDAADFGVPQHRKRVIIIGSRIGTPQFPEATHSDPAWPLLGTQPWVTVREALERIPLSAIQREDNYRMKHADYMVERMRRIKPGENFHVLPANLRPDCWNSGRHQGADTFGRLRPDQPSVTIRTSAFNPTKGRYIHPVEHRGLSTAEMAALQSFPSEYRFVGTIGSVGRQIGNAVPPLLGAALGRSIRTVIETNGTIRSRTSRAKLQAASYA